MSVQDISVGQKIKLEDGTYDVVAIEKGTASRKAEMSSKDYEDALNKRPLNRYVKAALSVEPHERDEVITEKWTCLRLKSRTKHWNIYLEYKVLKGEQE